ncbi:hypothetical protein HK097_009793, partial [Rhizophlyctis rosea]
MGPLDSDSYRRADDRNESSSMMMVDGNQDEQNGNGGAHGHVDGIKSYDRRPMLGSHGAGATGSNGSLVDGSNVASYERGRSSALRFASSKLPDGSLRSVDQSEPHGASGRHAIPLPPTPLTASEPTLIDPSPDAATPPSADPLSSFGSVPPAVDGTDKPTRHRKADYMMVDGHGGRDGVQQSTPPTDGLPPSMYSPIRRISRSRSRSASRSRSRSPSRSRSRSRSPRKSKVSAKRAQQNRAAQRAFRLRKEEYLRNLEARNRHLEDRVDNLRRYESQCRDLTAQLNQVDADRARMAREIEDLRRANAALARDFSSAEAEIARLNELLRSVHSSAHGQPPSGQMPQAPPPPAAYYPPYPTHHPPPSPLQQGGGPPPGPPSVYYEYHYTSPYPQQPRPPTYHHEYAPPPHSQQPSYQQPTYRGAQQQQQTYRHSPQTHPHPPALHDRRSSAELPPVHPQGAQTPPVGMYQTYPTGYVPSNPPPRPLPPPGQYSPMKEEQGTTPG